MAQIEFAGIKFTGGKMALVITLVTSLIGGLWGGFEVYKDYMDMKEKIQSYTAPDLSGLDKRIAVLENELTFVSDLKTDIKADLMGFNFKVILIQIDIRNLKKQM